MDSRVPEIVVRGICERDIDLLLLEEFVSSDTFRKSHFKIVDIDPNAELIKAERSVVTSSGESDLELLVNALGKTIKVLIENKIDAVLRPNQGGRYAIRGKQYCLDRTCDEVKTVLIAPSAYFANGETYEFDVVVHYETVLLWFESEANLGQRGLYKLAVLKQAIERGRLGWQSIPDPTNTSFWLSYWELQNQIARALRMPKPELKPATSNFVRFQPLILPREVELLHKLYYGHVDLQFAGMGDDLQLIQHRFGKYISPNMRIERAGKSAVIRIDVEPIDMADAFESSQAHVKASIEHALSLLQVYEKSIAK